MSYANTYFKNSHQLKTGTAHKMGRRPRKYIKKRSKKPTKLFFTLILLVSFILANNFSKDTPWQFLKSSTSTASYKEILSTSLKDITETLSMSELDNPVFLSLIQEADTYPQAKILLVKHEEYPEILLELAGNRPETLEFVINYPAYISSNHSATDISVSKDYTAGNIPLFIQWDKRWGYEAYGDEFIGSSACGPTALSMVIVGLTGNTAWNPKAVSDYSYESGYFHSGQGTSWNLMSQGANYFGLQSIELPLDAAAIISALRKGCPIIASMRPGHFTKGGHFIVLTGIASDGTIMVNDPGSIINSQTTWDLRTIMDETKNLWAFNPASL